MTYINVTSRAHPNLGGFQIQRKAKINHTSFLRRRHGSAKSSHQLLHSDIFRQCFACDFTRPAAAEIVKQFLEQDISQSFAFQIGTYDDRELGFWLSGSATARTTPSVSGWPSAPLRVAMKAMARS